MLTFEAVDGVGDVDLVELLALVTLTLGLRLGGYRGTVLHMQYHSTAAVPDFFFPSQVTKKL